MFLSYELLLIALTSFTQCKYVAAEKSITLLTADSFVRFQTIEWDITANDSHLLLPIRIRTRAIKGRLITLTGSSLIGGEIFELYAYINNAAVIVAINDANDKIIKKTEYQLPGVNNGEEHLMSIELNPKEGILKVVYGQGTVDSYDLDKWKIFEEVVTITITVGKYGDNDKGFVGCISTMDLTINDIHIEDLQVQNVEGPMRDDCSSLCTNYDCNEGTCLDLFDKFVCDCRIPQKSGAHCDKDQQTLNVSWDQHIAYKMSEDESQPTVISVDFRTNVQEGLVIHGSLISLKNSEPFGDLKLALIYGQLRFTFANLTEISFYNISFATDEYQEITLLFDYSASKVSLTFNGETKSSFWNLDGTEYSLRFSNDLFFSAGDSEVGLSGCLRGIYVDHFDVINGYYKNSTKVFASAGLSSCDAKQLDILALIPEVLETPIINEIVLEDPKIEKTEEETVLTKSEQMNEMNVNIPKKASLNELSEVGVPVGKIIMLQMAPTEPVPTEYCDNNEATNCKHHVECIKINNIPTCICEKGYAGQFCQFSLLPWNCEDVLRDGNQLSGTYIIDTDGSGSLPESYVYCDDGHTIIPHNLPDQQLIHASSLGDVQFILSYKLFNTKLIESLKNSSTYCEQKVKYSCESAPLLFAANKTWFASVESKGFGGLGGVDGTCPCTSDYKCSKCNCDAVAYSTDFGTVSGVNAPITSIYSLNDPHDGKGYITLGPLNCMGSAGKTKEFTMTIRKMNEGVTIGNWNLGSLSFEFRTYLKKATLLSSRDGVYVNVELAERHLRLMIGSQVDITLVPQSRKNDGHWHRVVIENVHGSVRFSVDDMVETRVLKERLHNNIELLIGGGQLGYLGCVRQIIIDGLLKHVEKSNQGNNGESGCENRCEFHHCQHDSKCVENFDTESISCVCKNSLVYSGEFCQHSVNYNTSVSLHDSKRAFLKIKDPPVKNMLLQNIVFSFSTDQADAVLIYLHDQLYNFVQIHLLENSHVVLTLNFNRTVQRCEVTAKVGREYSRMRWVQVMFFQYENRVELNVDDEICQIFGARVLASDFINQFSIASDMTDIIEPPVSPVMNEGASNPYVLLFVGGVPTTNYQGWLDPIYQSSIPNLFGCIRGLILKTTTIDMRNVDFWPYYPAAKDDIRLQCATGCHSIEKFCKNSGHCAVQWTASEVTSSCDCSRTSYYGEFCDKDNGAYFNGNSVLVFDSGSIFAKTIIDWNLIGDHSLNFAFSTISIANSTKQQLLATIYFQYDRRMELILCKNGSLNIAILAINLNYIYTFPYNYDDSYRHYFQATFRARKPLIITVDSRKHVFPMNIVAGLSLKNAKKFMFGGSVPNLNVEQNPDYKLATTFNYTGCISNIDINMNVPRMLFRPILYLGSPELEFSEAARVLGDPLRMGECNSFFTPGYIPPIFNTVKSPVWDAQLITRPFDAERLKPNKKEVESTSIWWIIILIIILLLLLAMIIFYILHYLNNKKRQPSPPPLDPTHDKDGMKHEDVPLLPSKNDGSDQLPFTIKSDFNLPEPDQHLVDIKSQSLDRSPIGAAPPSYASEQPQRSSKDCDNQFGAGGAQKLKDNDLDSTIKYHDDISQFDRVAPQRMSSFKSAGSPTSVSSPQEPTIQAKSKPPLPVRRTPVI